MSEQLHVRGSRWATDELADLLAELAEMLGQINAGCEVKTEDGERVDHRTPPLYEVFRLVAAARSDGFRRRSGVEVGGPASVLDDEGFPMPPRSDPTGELAVAEMRSNDPIRSHATNALRALVDARNLLRKAKSETVLAFEGHDGTEAGDPRCENHARAGLFEDTYRGTRCRWCYGIWLSEGADPDSELIRVREERRLSTRDIEAWKDRRRQRGSKSKGKRRAG